MSMSLYRPSVSIVTRWRGGGECKLGRASAGRVSVCVCVEREGELRQRHVGDVVWLPQAVERGGVVSAGNLQSESEVRETKARGEEARSTAP